MIDIVRRSDGSDTPARVRSVALVATLRDLAMPWAEIDAVLETDDPRLVRRYLELHRERLDERLVEQRATLAGIQALLLKR